MKVSPLDDLSFFRFPEVTPEVVRNIVLLFVLIAVVVLATLILQRFVNQMHSELQRRRRVRLVTQGVQLAPAEQEVLDRLVALAGAKSNNELLADSLAYETAVTRLAAGATEETLHVLGRLRQHLHLNVMNPTISLVSTRQLLPDLPLRLVARYGDEKLDLYCAPLEVNEGGLILELNLPEEARDAFAGPTRGELVYWREEEGETLFQVELEPAGPEEGGVLYRLGHALRTEGQWQRADFRLSTDFPVEYRYFEREAVRAVRKGKGGTPAEGEARLVDLSFGGAAFSVAEPLAVGGFAQLQFRLHDQAARVMVEVISCNRTGSEGRYLVRGRLRGMQAEGQALLNGYLAREQVKRLRERGVFVTRA